MGERENFVLLSLHLLSARRDRRGGSCHGCMVTPLQTATSSSVH
jgi:hypothetical protein